MFASKLLPVNALNWYRMSASSHCCELLLAFALFCDTEDLFEANCYTFFFMPCENLGSAFPGNPLRLTQEQRYPLIFRCVRVFPCTGTFPAGSRDSLLVDRRTRD